MKLAEYDPNYIYADNDDENQKMEADEGWGSDFDDEN